MSQYFLYGGLKWLKNVDKSDVNSINENSSIWYILEVNLEYPNELHKLQNDYPLAPEKLLISYNMLPDYCKEIADEYGIRVGDVKKLISILGDKTNYILHYRNFQLNFSLGMKLPKIHKVLKFKPNCWMKNLYWF